MAISINWNTRVIYIPKADTTLIQSSPFEIRELDLNDFRLALKDIEDGEGITYPDTHVHNTEVDIGGIVLARTITLINNYTVIFEDGNYAVNLVGANSNVADKVNLNQVSIRSFNSAGLQVVTVSGISSQDKVDIATEVWGTLISSLSDTTTIGGFIAKKLLTVAKFLALK